ncbi:single-stranded-DNA-specific exonuclease RecJ [Paracoccus shanxieyensis]|uniref:Single-stranded-DNA-specific exonuclease RecJ n=1 Tax=Paracoccus shanxieyensis TaxID=2675752 RepID=A0A6L6IXW3_9RHOB|nr:single-stranded-DNA-specific exonuclease RecJ [Paracoccus shanxieyensis]MTH63900.1 single-stranded-DNA-specific exonuclease RecJ [Paracoccus shanxieyensis]MTH86588.1 single-stranded-DNA-specific exonuclease RecJ [Paracoccus shanxieyensis]
MTAFLSVSSSLTGRTWRGPDAALDRAAEALAQDSRLPLPVSRVLAARGIPAHEAPGFLDPKLRDLLPDPLTLRDMDRAAHRIVAAVQARQRIAIFADYDVDGGASAALLIDWLRRQGLEATLYIPDRIDEGYGPNIPAMQGLAAAHDLIICVDCGTLSHEALAAAAPRDVIVLDHHQGGETLPDVLAVVNPNRQDEDGSLGHLCAAGVVFLTLVQCNRLLRAAGLPQPDLVGLLDLVALATVADVAPLVGVNRAFVRQGLTIMARRERPGLVALSDVARLDSAPSAFHLGFLLGPRINAGGRVGRADLGAQCLSCTDPRLAEKYAAELDDLNRERRAIEATVREAALAQVDARGGDPLIAWAAGIGWHPGVVGIVAARMKEATGLPSVVIGVERGIGKGSARSVPGVDLGRAIQRLAQEGLLLKGGGHAMAAGLTVEEASIPAAMERLSELLAREMADRSGADELRISGLLDPAGATVELMQMLERAGPYGQAAPAPRFAFADQVIDSASTIGDSHLRLRFRSPGSPALEAVAWGAMIGPLGPALLGAKGRRFHLAGKLELSLWGGRERVRLRLDDAAAVP